MRILVAIEGGKLPDGRTIAPGALYVGDEVVPVTYGLGLSEIVGEARDLQRDGSEVSMEIEWNPAAKALADVGPDSLLAAASSAPFETDLDDINRITKARVRQIAVSLVPGFPRGTLPE